MLAVAAVGVECVRWAWFDSVASRAGSAEPDRLDGLVDALATGYRRRHDWSFLPVGATHAGAWLRELVARSQDDPKRLSPSLPYRVGLLDRDDRFLAGTIASRAMIVFASIDTLERPVVVDGVVVGHVVVARSQDPGDDLAIAFLLEQQRNLLFFAAVGLLSSLLAAMVLARHFGRPIGRLVAGARQLEAARFDTRLSIRRSDELGELAETFNLLAARLEDTERARREWIADTSHELRTPLSVLRGQLEALQDGIRTASPENVATMLRQVQALTRRVEELYDLARADVGQMQYDKAATEVWPLVVEEVQACAEKFRAAELTTTLGAPPPRSLVYCDAGRIRQVVANLLENCVRYTAAGGTIEVHGDVAGEELRIVIDDSAPCVPAQALERLGERFFRVESSRVRQLGGAGLGLALCQQIVSAHDGRIAFDASPLGGLRVVIALKLED